MELPREAYSSLLAWEGHHQFGIQVLPQEIQTSPIQLLWCLRCCIWHMATFRGRCFFQFLGVQCTLWSTRCQTLQPLFGTEWLRTRARGRDGLPRSPHPFHIPLWGGVNILAACSPVSFVHRPWLSGKSSCRYGWVGTSASTEPQLFPLPRHPPQRPSRLIKFSGSAYELWQDRSPRRLEHRLSNPDYIQPNLAALSEGHARGKDPIQRWSLICYCHKDPAISKRMLIVWRIK